MIDAIEHTGAQAPTITTEVIDARIRQIVDGMDADGFDPFDQITALNGALVVLLTAGSATRAELEQALAENAKNISEWAREHFEQIEQSDDEAP